MREQSKPKDKYSYPKEDFPNKRQKLDKDLDRGYGARPVPVFFPKAAVSTGSKINSVADLDNANHQVTLINKRNELGFFREASALQRIAPVALRAVLNATPELIAKTYMSQPARA